MGVQPFTEPWGEEQLKSVVLKFSLENVYKTQGIGDDESLNVLLAQVFDALNYVSASSELLWSADFRSTISKNGSRSFLASSVFFSIGADRAVDLHAAKLTSEIYSLLDVAFAKHGLVFSSSVIEDDEEKRSEILPFEVGSAYEIFRRLDTQPYKSFPFSQAAALGNLYDFCATSDIQMVKSVCISPIYNWPESLEKIYSDFDSNFETLERTLLTDIDGQKADSASRYNGSIKLLFDKAEVPELVRRGIFSSIVGGTHYISHQIAESDFEALEEASMAVSPKTFFDKIEHARDLSEPAIFLHGCYKSSELANLINFPGKSYPGVEYNPFPNLTGGIEMMPETGAILGVSRKLGHAAPFEIRQRQHDRFRHSYVIGKTGTGKSSFLLNSILHDIAEGSSVVVVDPHGDLCDKVAERIPKNRIRDLEMFDVSDFDNPPCFNPLKVFESEHSFSGRDEAYQQTFIINQLNEFFLKYYGSEMFGPRIQDYFVNACRTVMQIKPNATIVDAVKLMIDKKYRETLLGPDFQALNDISDEEAKWFWTVQFKGSGMREQQEIIPYFAAKFTPFLADRVLNSVFGEGKNSGKDGIDITSSLESNKIILLKLSKGVLGGLGMSMLGTALVSRIVNYAISRGSMKDTTGWV